MSPLNFIARHWQKFLPVLAIIGIVVWVALFRHDFASAQAMFTALLVIYLLHQIEEHLWPGGFREFANARVFKSAQDNWPVSVGGVAFVNIALVWLPVAAAAIWPGPLRWIGLGWIGLTLVNGISHIATSIRFRIYNPGLITSIVLFLPFTLWFLTREFMHDALSRLDIVLVIVAGVLLHIPVAAIFLIPFLRRRISPGGV